MSDLKVIVKRIFNRIATEKEKRQFDGFIHALQGKEREVDPELGPQIWRRIEREVSVTKSSGRRLLWRVAVSVAVVLSLGYGVYQLNLSDDAGIEYISRSTEKGQRATLKLPDGSVVRLNAASTLTFPENFGEDNRKLSLTGEAYFEVERDTLRPFIIESGLIQTTVLGTSFNVKARGQSLQYEVSVTSGRVRVEIPDKPLSAVVLTPGEQAIASLNDSSLVGLRVNIDRFTAWTRNTLDLEDTPLSEVVSMLNDWYDVTISLQNEAMGQCKLSGKYKLDVLENLLDALEFAQEITYEKQGRGQYILKGGPCEP